MSTEEEKEQAELEELRKKREERRKAMEEEEKREAEERARKEEERKQRKLERERKSKEREEAHAKEVEESQKRSNAKDEERKRRREERERQKQEEERQEREAEEKRAREREEKKRHDEAEQEEKQKKKEQDALRRSQEEEAPLRDKKEEVRPDARRRQKNESLLDIIKSGAPNAMDKIVVDDDMKEQATKLVSEENELVVEFFNKPETIIAMLKYISTIHPSPEKLTDDEREEFMGRIEFTKEAITGGIPSLWRTILQPENRHYLGELFALLKNENPLLPRINITCFWSSIEFLWNRRSYEISNYIMRNKDVIPSFFRHLRDTNLMDIFIKLVEKEATASPLFKEYDPKKAAELLADDTKFWTDTIPDNILEKVGQGGKSEDTEWTDVEIESIAQYTVLVLDKFSTSKLAFQLRDATFCNALLARVFDPFGETSNGVANGHPSKAKYRHQSTVVALLSFITQLLKFSTNTSAYSTDTVSPLVAGLIYGSNGKGSKVVPINIIRSWINNKVPEFEFPIEHLGKKSGRTIGAMRVKCVQLLRALFLTNFQCVDVALRENGALLSCVELFFINFDNNIVHTIIEEIIKLFLMREANTPVPELDTSSNPITPFTQYLLDDCNLVERLVATLRTISVNKNEFSTFNTSKLDMDEETKPVERTEKHTEKGKTTVRHTKRADEKLPERDKPFLPPAFVGHVLDICKAITFASEKSVKVRHLVASCSGYHWGQTVMFHLGMRDSADMEWKKPFKKPVPQDNPPTKEGERSGD